MMKLVTLVTAACVGLLLSACGARASVSPTGPPRSTTETGTERLAAAAQTGTEDLTPTAGPVGTVVSVAGHGCNNPGVSYVYFYFGNPGGNLSGTLGSADFTIPVDSSGVFHGRFTIPSSIHSYQGRGGGAVVPGAYVIASLPPYCSADFTVLSSYGKG